jgi:hypothetical protein
VDVKTGIQLEDETSDDSSCAGGNSSDEEVEILDETQIRSNF